MGDIRINGSGSMTGGDYQRVVINGAGRCDGLFSAERIEVNGSFHCPGILKSGLVIASGSFRCDGAMKSDDLNVSGSLKCGGRLEAGRVRCSGAMAVECDVAVQELDVSGSLKVSSARLEADRVACSGSLRVSGQISADEIKVTGMVNAREIVGDRVIIHSGKIPWRQFLPGKLLAGLTSQAGLVEATVVELEGVTAETVNGQDVTIGPNCIIQRVDCSGTLFIHPTSSVAQVTGEYTKREA